MFTMYHPSNQRGRTVGQRQVDVQLEPPARVSLMPSLDDIQECINKSAQAILGCFKQVGSVGSYVALLLRTPCLEQSSRHHTGDRGLRVPSQAVILSIFLPRQSSALRLQVARAPVACRGQPPQH